MSSDLIAWICVALIVLAPVALLVSWLCWRASVRTRAAEREADEVDAEVRALLSIHRRDDEQRRRRP